MFAAVYDDVLSLCFQSLSLNGWELICHVIILSGIQLYMPDEGCETEMLQMKLRYSFTDSMWEFLVFLLIF